MIRGKFQFHLPLSDRYLQGCPGEYLDLFLDIVTHTTKHCQHLLLNRRLSFEALQNTETVFSASSLFDSCDSSTDGFEFKLSMDC